MNSPEPKKHKKTHHTMRSWVMYKAECEFPIQNLPYGVFQRSTDSCGKIGIAIGDLILDLGVLSRVESTLNTFMSLGRPSWSYVPFVAQSEVKMLLPTRIGDYTDFYSSKEHASNVGTMFRGKENALQPNWTRMPIGYHGRSSSVGSRYGPCRLMDFELEIGCFVGKGNELGVPININDALEENIFGLVLMNDWSARDIQKFEYPHKYLRSTDYRSYNIDLHWSNPHRITTSNFKSMYWTVEQQLVHHSRDLFGSGTISTTMDDGEGSMLEMCWKGKREITGFPDGSVRKFLKDGDEVIMTGACNGDGFRVGFGQCSGVVLPALPQLKELGEDGYVC
eukprot:GSMAST32.ASY1.ANO1.1111.1 assembled CDS